MDRRSEVKEFVIENFLFGDSTRIGDGTSFLEEGVVDSTGMLELVGFLESRYGITVEDEELIPENLDSLNRIEAYLAKKLARGQALAGGLKET